MHVPYKVISSANLSILKICKNDSKVHKRIFNYLREKNIGVQLHYKPVHLQPYYRNLGFKEGDFPFSEEYANSSISIPLFPGLTEEDQIRVFNNIFEQNL